MSIQSEAALEAGLIATLQQMDYEYVQIAEEENLQANFKRQLEVHNRKRLAEHGRTEFTDEEFEKILIHLEGGTRFEKAKKLRDLYPLDTADGKRIWVEFLNRQQWCQNEFQVSNQITVEGRKKCRYDVTILINGLPLVQIELKRNSNRHIIRYSVTIRHHSTDCLIISSYSLSPMVSIRASLPTTRTVAINSLSTGRMQPMFRLTNWISLPHFSWRNARLVKSSENTLCFMRVTNA